MTSASTHETAIRQPAHAKLTMSLRITGVRDDGYHLIDAEMVSLDLADELEIVPVSSPNDAGLTVDGSFAAGVPFDDTNLVMKAMHLCGRFAKVRLTKNVPHGGGLGGGSSDAAAYLRAFGYTDVVAASRLGADIPFCLSGGRARVRGIGERVEAMPFVPVDITLVIPPIQVSTPLAYRAWDDLGGPHDPSQPLFNDLEVAALAVEPALVEWKSAIARVAGTTPTLAGSGSTWFLIGHHGHIATALPEARVVLTRTTQPATS